MRLIFKITKILLLLLLAGAVSCVHHSEAGNKLDEIAGIVSDFPLEALERLDSIDYVSLSTRDRHYYDFLKLKAQDKAYIVHTSDSVILDLIDYYGNHDDREFFTEVLYYGGRVYSDMGDYPTALQYFHQAEESLTNNQKDTELKSRILSQTGRLLNTLRLYEEAIPYIEKSIEINNHNGNDKIVVYDLQLLSQIYFFLNKYEEAEFCLKRANTYNNVADNVKALNDVYLAEIYYKKENIDTALKYIKGTLGRVDDIDRNTALINAARIYLKKDSIYTAYMYVNEIISSNSNSQKDLAYYLIISSDLKNLYPHDSINKIFTTYRNLLEVKFNQNGAQLALDRQNIYNYRIHEEKRKKSEESKVIITRWFIGIAICLMMVIIAWLLVIIKNRGQQLKLSHALAEIKELKDVLSKKEKESPIKESRNEKLTKRSTSSKLKEKLREEIKLLCIANPDSEVSKTIKPTPILEEIRNHIKEKTQLRDSDWEKIRKFINKESPNFFFMLQSMSEEKLSRTDEEILMLMRFGIRSIDMAKLIGRSKSAVSERKTSLKNKLAIEKSTNIKIEHLILLIP